MTSNDNIIKIISPSKEVFDTYEKYKEIIASVLPYAKIQLIGSFAIPMKGKEEVDVLLETDNIEKTLEILLTKGFTKGPIVEGEAFMHCRKYPIMCDLHILPKGDSRVQEYHTAIKKLQTNTELRKDYEKLKESLSGKSKDEYKQAKKKFIKENNIF